MPTPEQIQEMNEAIARRQRAIDGMLAYNPNEDDKIQLWGAYAPSRRGPKYKVFTRHVDAVNSVLQSNGRSGAVYFYAAGRWQLEEIWVDGKELYR